jgi:hypothetical protein
MQRRAEALETSKPGIETDGLILPPGIRWKAERGTHPCMLLIQWCLDIAVFSGRKQLGAALSPCASRDRDALRNGA